MERAIYSNEAQYRRPVNSTVTGSDSSRPTRSKRAETPLLRIVCVLSFSLEKTFTHSPSPSSLVLPPRLHVYLCPFFTNPLRHRAPSVPHTMAKMAAFTRMQEPGGNRLCDSESLSAAALPHN